MIRTAGRWDPQAGPTYFIAGGVGDFKAAWPVGRNLLVAVNALNNGTAMAEVEAMIEAGASVLVDSGIFDLANQHAIKHDLRLEQAFGLAPHQIDGFADLLSKYTDLLTRLGDKVWGYIELDLGGQHRKTETRDRLEAAGLRPIPVFHPYNDAWDYFDHLAERYDRLCIGNLVQAGPADRKRLVATIWERRRRYPDLWIHLLGVTPSSLTLAYPMNSCDSSTWLSGVRWGHLHAAAATQRLWDAGRGFTYDRATSAGVAGKNAKLLHAYDAAMTTATMRRFAADERRELGADPSGTSISGWSDPVPGRTAR